MIYLSGPMTGLPGKNEDAFRTVKLELSAKGREKGEEVKILSPHDMPQTVKLAHGAFLKRDILAMLQLCTKVRVLPGWQKSSGAVTEVVCALKCGLRVSDGERFITPHEAAVALLELETAKLEATQPAPTA